MHTREKLIHELVNNEYLKTPLVTEAFEKIDRKDFVIKEMQNIAYLNQALPIGHGQTISQPLTVAFMLELLKPKQGETILDIGAGSGWQTALLASIIGEGGKVIAIERISELKKMAQKNIAKYNFIENGITEVIKKDGTKGHRKNAPYDKIIAAAAATEIPQNWKQQLKIGGYIVAPINHSIIRLEKKSAKEFKKKEFFGFSFVPLVTS